MAIIGLDLGGTKTAVIAADDQGRIGETRRFPTTDPDSTFERICLSIEELTDVDAAPLVGISCGDPQDSARGLILSPPNMPGWDEVPIVARVAERFGAEAYLMNDANAGALAEWRYGAARGFRN
ncbi:unnamed protein product, partial [marine sediment metagenome]